MDNLSFYAQAVGIVLGAIAVAGVLIAILARADSIGSDEG